jgi:prepilin signal peptidase PulO-like enzyme (type II secretory pathway)
LAWHHGASWQLLWALGLSLFLIALAFIDAEHQLLPDVLTYPLMLFAFLASIARQLLSASNVTFDIFFTDPSADFVRWKVALYGALWLALAAPLLFALDWLDGWLFDRYFDEEEPDQIPQNTDLGEGENRLALVGQDTILPHSQQAQFDEGQELAQPFDAATAAREEAIDAACAAQRYRVVTSAFAIGLALAAIWALWIALDRKTPVPTLSRAYEGITNAVFGAFIAGGIIWMLRAVYFWLRKAEGMGLGDVKMMAGIGAYLGWIGAFGVLLYGSILGAVFGIAIAWRGANRWQTLLPFGTCLAFAALLVLLQS